MPVKLYKFNLSTPSRTVLMTLDILDLKVETEDVNTLVGDQHKPDFLAKNPLHTVPVLEDDDLILTDSHVIITYLVSRYGAEKKEQLYPTDVQVRAIVDQRLFFDTSHLFPKIMEMYTDICKNKATCVAVHIKSEVEEGYAVIEKYLEKTTYLACDHVTLADISCVATVSSLATVIPVDEKYVKLHEWWNKLKKETWYQKVNEPGAAAFSSLMNNGMKKNLS